MWGPSAQGVKGAARAVELMKIKETLSIHDWGGRRGSACRKELKCLKERTGRVEYGEGREQQAGPSHQSGWGMALPMWGMMADGQFPQERTGLSVQDGTGFR